MREHLSAEDGLIIYVFVKEKFNNDRMEAHIAANDIFEQVKAAIQDRLYCCKLHLKVYYIDSTNTGTSGENVAAVALRSLRKQPENINEQSSWPILGVMIPVS